MSINHENINPQHTAAHETQDPIQEIFREIFREMVWEMNQEAAKEERFDYYSEYLPLTEYNPDQDTCEETIRASVERTSKLFSDYYN